MFCLRSCVLACILIFIRGVIIDVDALTLWFLSGPPAPILSGIHSDIYLWAIIYDSSWVSTGVICADDLTWLY